MSTSPEDIAESSKCYCLDQLGLLRGMLYVLNQIHGGTMTIEEIAENSKCYCFNQEQAMKAMLYLLVQIYTSGATGGGMVLYGSGSPEGVETAAVGTLYVDTDAPRDLWFKETGSGDTGWVALIENLP